MNKNYQSAVSQHGASAEHVEPSNDLDKILYRLKDFASMAAASDDRLTRIISRAYGDPLSAGKGVDGPRPLPSGMVAALTECLDDLNGSLDAIENRIGRLDGLV